MPRTRVHIPADVPEVAQLGVADPPRHLVTHLPHVDGHLVEGPRLGVAVAVHDDAVVALVDEVRAPADVVQLRGLALPVAHLPRVRHEPHVDVVVLREPLDLGEHLRDVLGLGHITGPLMVQLVVRVDHEPLDPVAHHRHARQVEHPVHRGQLVVLAADEEEVVIEPLFPHQEAVGGHPLLGGVRPCEERLAYVLLHQLASVVPNLVLHRAERKVPLVLDLQVAQERVDPLRLAAVGHPRDDREVPRHHPVELVHALPARAHPALLAGDAAVVVRVDLDIESGEAIEPLDGILLGSKYALRQCILAEFH
mmetsp:Transcript_17215/g.55120  ORF Transcript_17215/g.55120 Transcript_17215/m.55120 type:complete len:309 (+) Transcript_17215:1167-2093(+)